MKNKEIRARMQEALEKSIESYQRLIVFTDVELGKWRSFGQFDSCRFCLIAQVDSYSTATRCELACCPAFKAAPEDSDPPCWSLFASELACAVPSNELERIKRLAKARLEELLKSARKMGYKVDCHNYQEAQTTAGAPKLPKVLSQDMAAYLVQRGVLEEIEEVSFPIGLYVRCTDEHGDDYYYESKN